jgi:hypothetical protein
MANITISDFYRVCRNAARFFPATSPVRACLQLQAFRVLQRDPRQNAEVGTDTLGAVPTDKGSPFFWSRQWELSKYAAGKLGYSYPLLTAFEMINETTSGVFTGKFGRTYTIELSVLDVFKPEGCKAVPANACDGRSINQIYLDTEFLLDYALRYIGGTVVATITSDPVPKVYNKEYLQAVYPGNHTIITDFGFIWAGQNQKLQFVRVEYPTKQIYGTKVRVAFKVESCPAISFKTDAVAPGVVGFELGCENC